MKNRKKIWVYAMIPLMMTLACAAFMLQSSCKKERNIARIATTLISNVTEISASCGGEISSDGLASITEKGVCWSSGATPTTANSRTYEGEGSASFTSSITGLAPNTLYHVRAYATNEIGTAYGSILTIHTWSGSVTDIDGNVYPAIIIGTQEWMGTNLKTTRLNDGSGIQLLQDAYSFGNSSGSAYCPADSTNNPKNSAYGNLYNRHAMISGKLCPAGWHVPSDTEWEVLAVYLGGDTLAGGKMKESGTAHWLAPNTGAFNESGFTGLPSGFLSVSGSGGGGCDVRSAPGVTGLGSVGSYWSATLIDSVASVRTLTNQSTSVDFWNITPIDGFAVRCIRDK